MLYGTLFLKSQLWNSASAINFFRLCPYLWYIFSFTPTIDSALWAGLLFDMILLLNNYKIPSKLQVWACPLVIPKPKEQRHLKTGAGFEHAIFRSWTWWVHQFLFLNKLRGRLVRTWKEKRINKANEWELLMICQFV